jgi:colanic acid biosynthesis glycosyl transferase WcaI
LRILIYSINYAPELTGIGKYNGELAEWLSSRENDVRVITAPPYYPEWKLHPGYQAFLYKKECLNRVEVFRCPVWVPSNPTALKRVIHLLTFAVSSFPVMLSNMIWKPDVIITVEPPILSVPGSLLTALFSRSKTLLHIQDFEIDAAFELGIIRSSFLRKVVAGIESFFIRRFTRVSSISPNMIKLAFEKGVESNAAILFPNWADSKAIYPYQHTSPFRNEYNIPFDKVIALYSGNMGEKQGLEIIIEAARQLQSNFRIQFVMCGSGSAYKRLRKDAEGLHNILWIPLQPVERLNDLLNFADIHLLPQSENVADLVMPSKLTGILASGRPVVATAQSGTQLADVVQNRGIVTEPGNDIEFSKAIEKLTDKPEMRTRFGKLARQYATDYLDRDVVLSKFESDLNEVVNN